MLFYFYKVAYRKCSKLYGAQYNTGLNFETPSNISIIQCRYNQTSSKSWLHVPVVIISFISFMLQLNRGYFD